jgi:uncharacterized damage-inducible protein DinB
MNRPEKHEFDPYYNTYISIVPDEALMPILITQPAELREIFSEMPEERGGFAYAEGKWTVKELLSHVIDGERIFAYRILRISRGDETPIEGFEQDGYIENSNANNRSFADLLDEFELQRRSNVLLLKNLSAEGEGRIGTASEKSVSVRALAYILAGHVIHHIDILRYRYFGLSNAERAFFGVPAEVR